MATRARRKGVDRSLARPLAPVVAALAGLAISASIASGCGSKPPVIPGSTAPASATATTSASGSTTTASATATASVTATASATPTATATVMPTTSATAATSASAEPPPCWKGFAVTGNAVNDLSELSRRCASGMQQIVPPVKHSFKEGEAASFPVIFPAGCFRVIAVGGAGVKDVDLMLKNNGGTLIAADLTPDDVYPMIHPNKEICFDSLQILTMSMLVKKGSGEVAGGVWKRP